MLRDYVVLLLPVAWAVIATLIGIVLYRSSEAVFENFTGSNGAKRSLRLTGSVVIAALAFYGIKVSTPAQNLVAANPGMAQVPVAEVRLAISKANENVNDLVVLESCLELDQSGKCRDQLTVLQNRARELQQIIERLLDSGN